MRSGGTIDATLELALPSTAGSRPASRWRPCSARLGAQVLVERGDAVVVEARRDGAEHRQRLGVGAEELPVAGQLAAHVAERVLGAAALELVDHHRVGEVEHVDLLELAGRAELGRHHVERHVAVLDDPGVALPDAGRLDDHEVEAGRLDRRRWRRRAPRAPRCSRGWPSSGRTPAAARPRSCGCGRRAARRRRAAGWGRWPAPRRGPCPPGRAGPGGSARR